MGNLMNSYSKKLLVFVLFFLVLAVSLLFSDVVKKDNMIEAAECSNPVDVMLVIDISGSMSTLDQNGEERIEVAKDAAKSFVENLDTTLDRVGLVTFETNVVLSSGLTNNFGLIKGKINSLDAVEGGQTNTEAAIISAREELNNFGRDSSKKVMIILSDGIPNRSLNTGDPVDLAETAASVAKGYGIRIISIGLDIEVDSDAETFMKNIASAPGDYYSSSGTYDCGLDENGDPFNYLVCIYKQISASICDNTPPVITKISKTPAGTLYSRDDLIIKSEISDDFGIKEHKIKWSTNGWETENIEICTVFSGNTNTCEKNIGAFGEGTTVLYKSYVVDTNDNETEGTEGAEEYKSVEVASTSLEINGDANGKLYRNQNNTIKINISDPQGKANSDEFYVSVDSIDKGEEIEFNKELMSNCSGDGYNWSCINNEFNPDCSWTDASVDVYVYPHSADVGYHNYTVKKAVDLVNPDESLLVGNCSDGVDNDCDGKIDLISGLEEPDCDNVSPAVAISRKVSGAVKTDIYNNDSVTLSSTATDLPEGLNGLIQHTIYWSENGSEWYTESCGSATNCEKVIGTFSAGTKIEYYAKATDSSIVPNSSCDPSDCSTRYSFIVKDFECDEQPDLTECSGGSGACCNDICDTTQDSNPYDSECSKEGCNGSDWGWVVDNEDQDCSDGANSDGCYAVDAGCEERNYSCSSGSCMPVIYDKFDDVCVGLVFNDYGCNGLECELLSSGNDPSCDNQLESISVVAKDSDGNIISSGGDVLDSKTDKVTLTSSASDTYNIAQHKIFWTSNGWTSTNEIDCGSVEECSGQIGPFGIGVTVQYYSRAVDGNNNTGETAHYSSFTVVDSSCYGVSDMTSCEKDGNSGKCCGGFCDTSFNSSTAYDAECIVEGCNLESWEYIPIPDGTDCNAAGEDACFSYFSGCEKRDYSCATGLCLYTPVSSNTDICSEDIFIDYGCSGADCSSTNIDCSACGCNCGSYNLDEKIYSSLSFDGVDDYVDIGPSNDLGFSGNKFSISAWVRTDSTVQQFIVCNGAGGGVNDHDYQAGYIIYNGVIAARAWANSEAMYVEGTTTVVDNTFHHVVMVYDGDLPIADRIKIYVDGTKENVNSISLGASDSTGDPFSTARHLVIGKEPIDNRFHFNGVIDEVRIYNRALADDEIFQHYQGVYQNELGLVGHWKLDDIGNTATDSSGNGNDGTLTGPTWVKSFDNPNNVPSYWRVCADAKDNDCDGKADENEEGCDGELTTLSISAKYGDSLEYTVPDDGNIYDADLGTLKLISNAVDNIFGINEHSVYWKINGTGLTSKDCGSSGICEVNESDLGALNAGDIVEYKSYAADTNNNSKCDPVDCNDYYSFTVRDSECFDIASESNISGSCDDGNGECCGGICDTSFDDSNVNGYDADCRIKGCNEESWEWIPASDGTSCNADESGQCSVYSVSGCETTNYECFSGQCEYTPINQKSDYCFDDYFFKDYRCTGIVCNSVDSDCSNACGCNCGSYNLDEKIYSSLSFDGVDDYVKIGNDSSVDLTNEFTLEAWVNPESATQNDWAAILGRTTTVSPWPGYNLSINDASPKKYRFWFSHSGGIQYLLSTSDLTANWTHVVG
jgi:hypothetical protein